MAGLHGVLRGEAADVAGAHTDDQEHRDQAGFEEDVEQDQVECGEHADHEGLEHQEGNDIFRHPRVDRIPAGQKANRRKERRQQDQRQ